AFLTGATRFPIVGAAAPACEVEKNTGSIESKSRSSRIRCTRTDPTIPRHPMSPTFIRGSVYQGQPSKLGRIFAAILSKSFVTLFAAMDYHRLHHAPSDVTLRPTI